jgi:uncharacterized membrane protein
LGNLIAFGFDRSWAANEVLNALRADAALDDAFVVQRSASGLCAMRRVYKDTGHEAADPCTCELWREMVRLLFLNASLDLAIPRGGSGLFVLLKDAVENRILRAVKPYRGRILKTSLSREAEKKLKASFTKAA